MLDNGERCSNQAEPGREACRTHRRQAISFRRVSDKAADTAPKPPPAKQPKLHPPQAINWLAVPSTIGAQPVCPLLKVDNRNILVAARGFVWLQGEAVFSRLVQLLGLLSQQIDLGPHLEIVQRDSLAEVLLIVTPPVTDGMPLSDFYDQVSAAVRLVQAGFYIGKDGFYIQYRDDGALRGYDVPLWEKRTAGNTHHLIAHWGTQTIDGRLFTPYPLGRACLLIAPIPTDSLPNDSLVYALVPLALYRVVSRYLRDHHVHYRLARLHTEQGELILFEAAPRLTSADNEAHIPHFIIDYLARLPQVVILTPAAGTTMLVERGYQMPFYLPHTQVFADGGMVLFCKNSYNNLAVNPTPVFFEADLLMGVSLTQTQVETAQSTTIDKTLQLPVLLRPDYGSTAAIAAIVLSREELGWIQQLLYRLPRHLLAAYQLAIGKQHAVLLGGSLPIESIPFGEPLRQIDDHALFIPHKQMFVPLLPWSILSKQLDIDTTQYTFITETERFDIPKTSFFPLTQGWVIDQVRPLSSFQVQPLATLPKLKWDVPDHAVRSQSEDKLTEASQGGWGRMVQSLLRGRSARPAASEHSDAPKTSGKEEVRVDIQLRKEAAGYEEAGHWLAAALCYQMANDMMESARCYQKLLNGLPMLKREG